MSNKLFFVGNNEEYEEYLTNVQNIDMLPIKNLPMCYFPFFYDNSEMSIEKMKKIVSLVENKTRSGDSSMGSTYTINTEELFSLLSTLEEPYQPFNNNNIFHIKIAIIIFWILVILGILKLCYYYFQDKYVYFMLLVIFLLLIVSTVWSLTITSKSF